MTTRNSGWSRCGGTQTLAAVPGCVFTISQRIRYEIVIVSHREPALSSGSLQKCYEPQSCFLVRRSAAATPGQVSRVVRLFFARMQGWLSQSQDTTATTLKYFREGPLAHLVEQGTFNPKVPGSSPGRPTTKQAGQGASLQ